MLLGLTNGELWELRLPTLAEKKAQNAPHASTNPAQNPATTTPNSNLTASAQNFTLTKLLTLDKLPNPTDNPQAENRFFSVDSRGGMTAMLIGSGDGDYKIGVLRGGEFRAFALDERAFAQTKWRTHIAGGANLRRDYISAPTTAQYLGSARLLREVFVADERTILAVTLGSELFFINAQTGAVDECYKFSVYGWGDAFLERGSGVLVLANESGVLYFYDTAQRKFEFEMVAHNDLIYQVALRNGRLLTGSADKTARYERGLTIGAGAAGANSNLAGAGAKNSGAANAPKPATSVKKFPAKFNVYGVALGEGVGAYSELDKIALFDDSGRVFARLDYGGETIVNMGFFERFLVVATQSRTLYIWERK